MESILELVAQSVMYRPYKEINTEEKVINELNKELEILVATEGKHLSQEFVFLQEPLGPLDTVPTNGKNLPYRIKLSILKCKKKLKKTGF